MPDKQAVVLARSRYARIGAPEKAPAAFGDCRSDPLMNSPSMRCPVRQTQATWQEPGA